MNKAWKLTWLLAGLAFAPLAQADTGYTTGPANLRTGPDAGYPRILTLPAGAAVEIYGCIDDWSWCDVQWRGERGWLSAGLIDYSWSGRRVGVESYGPQLGLPILVFGFDSYWSSHYRNRAWYRDRDRWQSYRPPPRPHPAPRPPSHGPSRPPNAGVPGPRPPGDHGDWHRPPTATPRPNPAPRPSQPRPGQQDSWHGEGRPGQPGASGQSHRPPQGTPSGPRPQPQQPRPTNRPPQPAHAPPASQRPMPQGGARPGAPANTPRPAPAAAPARNPTPPKGKEPPRGHEQQAR